MRFDMIEKIVCKKCKEDTFRVDGSGMCKSCQNSEASEEKRNMINSLCKTCKKRCNQNALIEIIKCPTYDPKMPSDAQKGPLEARSKFPAVAPLVKKACRRKGVKRRK